jgi:UPF0176 protein
LLFIQCEACNTKMQNCCSDECTDFIQFPIEKQREMRKGLNYSNKIFKKGRSEKLTFKKNNEKLVP